MTGRDLSPEPGGVADLPDRGLVVVGGADRGRFLQNLVTNDVGLLETEPVVYAALLTPQGKFLHDFFMISGNGSIFLETEGGARAEDLARRLNLYRLRADVTITVVPRVRVLAQMSGAPHPPPFPESRIYPDPRDPEMGFRVLILPSGTLSEIIESNKAFDVWDRRRIALRIPDGSRDIVLEQDNIIETGLGRLNGVSFTKGCYVGQEVTARLNHRGLSKKHLYALHAARPLPPPGTDIRLSDGRLVGQMRSSRADLGLALLRDDLVAALGEEGLFIPYDR